MTSFAVSGGGASSDGLQAVAVDAAGALVAAGYFGSSPAMFGDVSLATIGSSDAVVWKQSAEGTTLWAVRGGGTSNDKLYGVAVHGAGAVVVVGHFVSSSATFGDETVDNVGDAGTKDASLWKLSAEGTTLWAVGGGGASSTSLKAVAVDGAGAVVAAGHSYSSMLTFGGVSMTNAGSADGVLWKLNAEGSTLWAVIGGGVKYDTLNGMAVDGAYAVVATGRFTSYTATFGGVVLTNAAVSYNSDAVVWKIDADGTTLWAVSGGGTSDDHLTGVAVDGANAVVAAGYFYSDSATFGGVELTKNNNAGNYNDAVLWKLNAEGTTLWAVRGDGTGADHLNCVAVDGAGGVVAGGYFVGSTATFGSVSLTNAGSAAHPVMWRVSAEGTTLSAVYWDGTSNGGIPDQLNGVTVDSANAVVAVGSFSSNPATFQGELVYTAGGEDAVVWKVSDDKRCTYSPNHVLLDTALSPSRTSHDSHRLLGVALRSVSSIVS